MKKILFLTLCLLLCAALAAPASAAGTATLSTSQTTVYRGDTFTVYVSVSDVGSCRSGGIEVTYGSSFELIGGEWTMPNTSLADFSTANRDGVFALESATSLSGKIFSLTFKVKGNAAFGTDSVSVRLWLNNEEVSVAKAGTVTIACKHTYGGWTNLDGTFHTHTCTTCGATEKHWHWYDHACDTTCNGCGAVRTTSHQYAETWSTDENGHWHACIHCGAKTDEAEHIPGEEAGEYNDQICTACNYVLNSALGHTHRYSGTFQSDAEGHWEICVGCQEETEHIAHTFDGDCDTDCAECDYIRQITHKDSGVWRHDETYHWTHCTDCGETLNKTQHLWVAGAVMEEPTLQAEGKELHKCAVCGEEKTVAIPALTLFQALPWWAWLTAGAVGGVLLTVIVSLAIILPIASRSKKGKYSSKGKITTPK